VATHSLDDLRRVIRRIETRRPKRPAPQPIEEVLGGELVDTGEGTLLVVRREFPLSHRHGRQTLGAVLEAPLDLLSTVARAEHPVEDTRGLLFLDAETTGLAGGTGTYAFLVGAAWLEDDRLVLTQHFMRDFDEEPALLAALGPLLERASGLVTFNGATFDLPLLETRFLMTRRRWPATLTHLDLLRPARRVWTSCLADCRLATLEREVVGVVREDDIAGGLIPSLYFDFLRSRRAAPLGRVLAHNRDDVLTLVGLLGWFGKALTSREELSAAELGGLGRLWEPVDVERALDYYRARALRRAGAGRASESGQVGEALRPVGRRVHAVGGGGARCRLRSTPVGRAGQVPRAPSSRFRRRPLGRRRRAGPGRRGGRVLTGAGCVRVPPRPARAAPPPARLTTRGGAPGA